MGTPEAVPGNEQDPRLAKILDQYGDVLVTGHGQSQPLSKAVAECPPFVNALLSTENPEELEQIVQALRAPE